MVRVTVGTNTQRSQVLVDPSTTIREVLDDNNINYAVGGIHLDGLSIGGAALDKTFTEHGINESCFLISVVKADGGIC